MAGEERKEVYFQSLVIRPEGMPIEELLQKENFGPSVVGIHAVVDQTFTAEHLAGFVHLITHNTVDPAKIHVAETVIDDRDKFFAKEFGLSVTPRYACLRLWSQEVEAWISSVLLSSDHPLAGVSVPNSGLLLTNSTAFKFKPGERRLIPYDLTASSYFVRLTAEDRPLALSEICTVFGDAEISIRSIIQPPVPEGSPTADIGFLFHPTATADIYTALQKVETMAACKSVDTVLKVMN